MARKLNFLLSGFALGFTLGNLASLFYSHPSWALTQQEITDALGITPKLQAVSAAFISNVGIGMNARSFEPATTLGTSLGFDIGMDVVLSKVSPKLQSSLTDLLGSSINTESLPFLPSLRFHLNKGLSENVEIGFTYLPGIGGLKYIGGTSNLGAELKIVLFRPVEGPVWAFRLGYDTNEFVLKYSPFRINVKTTTITPQLLLSMPFDWANPYMGTGFQFVQGSITGNLVIPEVSPDPLQITSNDGTASALYFFGGITMKVPLIGFKVALEGGYYPNGMNYIGSRVGFEF
jgi:hypothetical protein